MFSKLSEPHSIATQLVILFTVCATLLLSCGLGVLYWIVVRHAFEEDNAVLIDKLAAIRVDLKQPDGLNTVDRELKNQRAGEPAVYWVRIIDSSGTVLAQTPGIEKMLSPEAFPSPQISSGIARSGKDYQTGSKLFSLLAATESVNGHTYTIQIAQDRSSDERFHKQFRALLALVLGFGIIVSALIAVSVTRRGLLPLAKMKRSLERVRAQRLNERIEPAGWPSELRPLASSFDAMLERLESSFTRLSQFSADLAHELRTPVGNMLGEAQVALTRERSSNEYRAVIESTAAECERLSAIIDNLLFLARAESAEQQIERSNFSARTALEKIVAFYQASAEDRGIEISCNGDAEIFADPLLFNRAVGNLIENALRFTPADGHVRITARQIEQGTEISVADSGSGIEREHLPHLFERFYRADPSRSSEGTGLGLALVKSIVELHGGSAAVESQTGQGTTITLVFPK